MVSVIFSFLKKTSDKARTRACLCQLVCEARKDRNNIRLNGGMENRRLMENGPVLI